MVLVGLVFEVHRGFVTERAVESLSVIVNFDGLKDELSGVFAIFKDEIGEEFIFESAPERFDGGIIIAIGLAAHAGLDTGVLELSAVFRAGVLRASVGMMKEAFRRKRLAMFDSHGEGIEGQAGLEIFLHSPADDFAAVEIHNAGEIEPTFPGSNVGNVTDPDLINGGGSGPVGQAIGREGMRMVAIGGADAKTATAPRDQAVEAHEFLDAFTTAGVAARSEDVGKARAAIRAFEFGEEAFKDELELLIGALTSRRPTFAPGVVGAAAELQSAAEFADGVERLEIFHSLATLGRSERMAIVFFKISHWLRKLCSSALAARRSPWSWAGD